MDKGLDTNSLSLAFAEGLFEDYLKDADSVPADWRNFFASLENGADLRGHFRVAPSFRPKGLFVAGGSGGSMDSPPAQGTRGLQHRVEMLVRNYRVRGHRMAAVDPLGQLKKRLPELTPEFFGLSEAHMDMRFVAEFLAGGGTPTLREILEAARNTYCRSIGVQFMHIDNISVRTWLQSRMETTENRLQLSRQEQLRILTRLTDAVIFEEFIQKKYVGAKSFSLEGAETLIPLLDMTIEKAGNFGFDEIIIGMPHRGRLNVLANIMGKHPRKIFREFDDAHPEWHLGRGDVRYHLGYHTDWLTTSGKRINLALAFNPSHLEFVNCVVLGRLRARNDRMNDPHGRRGMAILIHGDAAFAGEGIVQETLNLSRLEGYGTGGTLHVIVNNQIGFTTTSNQSRSTTYASDVAKMLQSPIFHVNGEDPEAVAQVVNLAMEFRHAYRRDVIIDMYCFRRRGHNEGDEPAFTQPLMYKDIKKRRGVREGYLKHLLSMNGVTKQEADVIAELRRVDLEQELYVARQNPDEHPDAPSTGAGPDTAQRPTNVLRGVWAHYAGGPEAGVPEADTRVSAKKLSELLNKLVELPETFTPHPKLKRMFEGRRAMARGEKVLDWSAGEALALASLATEGVRIRMSGQDCERGTFSHRHSVLHDYKTGALYRPFQHLSPEQGAVDIINSCLSEAGVLGFEYGYSVGAPDGLVIWEAQFGDFANVAQVIIDQFIATAEDKWQRLTGLVMLLPHGLEGTGPEHASARLERYLQLAAEDNMQIVNLTTPAQFFHCLRRQVLRPWRKPLIVMAPKSMLRHPRAVSSMEELAEGAFQRVIPDKAVDPKSVKRILLCSGKVYYDLVARRETLEKEDIAIIRVEQLHPLEEAHLTPVLAPYTDGTPAVWVQEDPENQGAWRYMWAKFGASRLLGRFPFSGVYRPASASPATGSAASHKMEQEILIRQALDLSALGDGAKATESVK